MAVIKVVAGVGLMSSAAVLGAMLDGTWLGDQGIALVAGLVLFMSGLELVIRGIEARKKRAGE